MCPPAFVWYLLLISLGGALPAATAFSTSVSSFPVARAAPSVNHRPIEYHCKWTSSSCLRHRALSDNLSLDSSFVKFASTTGRDAENSNSASDEFTTRLAPPVEHDSPSARAGGGPPAAARAAIAVFPSSTTIASAFAAASWVITSALTSSASSSWSGLMALTAVSSLVLVPLTQVQYLYSISVGYGLSVGAMGLALRRAFRPVPESVGDALAGCTVFYGLRLASFLWLREQSGYRPTSSLSSSPSSSPRKEPSRLSRLPFSLSLAFFYACMMSPVLFVLRNPPARLPSPPSSATLSSVATVVMLALRNWRCHAAWAGAIVAWIGAVLEATADAHKLSVKNTLQETAPPVPPSSPDDDDNTTTPIVLERPPSPRFAGPTGGAYRITRHPNYTGEVLHWLGTYVAGTSCLVGRKGCWGWWDAATWLASTAGLYGIVSIMRAATARLEERQSTKYAGDPAYESWKDQVKAPLIPLVNS